ncbi:sulfite exporter TauE/SafE family protein [candidate division WWE3 bacterium]|uniref:Sulfite exporter TauE/SafE family protein n=1 Tax=candidate division WWE3 bacterium TaxID=2053526 RepID=A0A955LVK7_UNCKA|nr:sulfite exporter TauE/SafE family protein [candidate division WWE3 bacterium]
MSKKKDKQSILYVDGMHCAACEVLIEKAVKKSPGIIDAKASTARGEVVITHDSKQSLDISTINESVQVNGYSISTSKLDASSDLSFITFSNNQLLFHQDKFNKLLPALLIAGVLIFGFYWLSESGIAAQVMVSETASWTVFLLFGLVAGASTCAALVGGVLLSLSKTWNDRFKTANNKFSALLPHGMFYVGRLAAFAVVGGLLAYLGTSIQSTVNTISPFIALFVGGVMALLGLQMLNVKWAQRYKIVLPKQLSLVPANSDRSNELYGPMLTGVGSILLPCGMTITAFLMVINSNSFTTGALNMVAFGLGTALSLSLVSIATVGFAFKEKYATRFYQVAGLLVVFFGFYTINAQLNVFGLPSANDIAGAFTSQPSENSQAVLSNQSVQVMSMEASAYGYSPASFTVQSGVPVRWEINNTGASGCTNAIIARGLFDGQVNLKAGMNVVEFTPQKKGNYKFSCWMGMVGGSIIVT